MVGGRTLDATRDAEIKRATLELLSEEGYDRVTIDAIAARAKAGKATIYRRWGSKAELVVEALNDLKASLGSLPDTGSLAGDLHAFYGRAAASPDSPFRLVCGLAPAVVRDAELARAFHEGFVAARTAEVDELIERARRRGEVPVGRDFTLWKGLFPALVLHRMMFVGVEPDAAYVRAIVDQVLLPLALAPAATSEQPTEGPST